MLKLWKRESASLLCCEQGVETGSKCGQSVVCGENSGKRLLSACSPKSAFCTHVRILAAAIMLSAFTVALPHWDSLLYIADHFRIRG